MIEGLSSPLGDLGIGMVWDNHPILSSPIQHLGPSVVILFEQN